MTTEINAGRVAMVPKGEWSASTAYVRLDVVQYNGSSYVCKQDSTGQNPSTATTYWQLLASGVDPSNYYTKSETNTKLAGKQDALVSGQNIKSINGQSVLGEGNLELGELFVVTMTRHNSVYTADKSVSEIYAASYTDGKPVIAVMRDINNPVFILTDCDPDGDSYVFSAIESNTVTTLRWQRTDDYTYELETIVLQPHLVSGTNIKTVNNESLLGSGNVTISGKSAYQSYVDTTTDSPVKTEAEWVASLKGEDGVSLGEVAIADNQTTDDATKVLSARQGYLLGQKVNDVDDEPTAGSEKFVKSGGVFDELALGAVYDVSAKNPKAGINNDGKWESLSALLSDANLNTLIPGSVRKGGMSIKFVQSSDNKYVQYFLTKDEWSLSEADWQKMNLEEEVSRLNQEIYGQREIELSESGYYINNGLNVGDVVSLTPLPSQSPYRYAIIDLTSLTDSYILLNGQGGYTARLWSFLDSSNKIISVAAASITEVDLKLTIPTGANKLVINTMNNGVSYIIFETSLKKRVEKTEQDIESLETRTSNLEDKILMWPSDNLWDKDNVYSGYLWSNSNGTPVANTDWRMTPYFIPIIPGTKISVWKKGADTSIEGNKIGYYVAEFDANKNFIQRETVITNKNYQAPDGVAFVKISIYKNAVSSDWDLCSYAVGSRYTYMTFDTNAPFGHYADRRCGFKLQGKKIAYFGDSIIGSSNLNKYLNVLNGAEVYNVGFGGCRMAKYGNDAAWNAFSMYKLADAIATQDYDYQDQGAEEMGASFDLTMQQSLATLKSIDWTKIDIIIIHYGTNDWASGSINIGTGDMTDNTDFKGMMKYSIETILSAYPHIRIVFDSAIYRYFADEDIMTKTNSKGNTLIEYNTAIQDVCLMYELQYLDVFNGLFNAFNKSVYFVDNTHPNDRGYKLMGERVANLLY